MPFKTALKNTVLALAFSLAFLTSGAYGDAASLKVVSFNIQFLGHFKKKDNKALAKLLSDYDLVFIQELVAPPIAGKYPDGTPFKADTEAKGFFDAMAMHGFSYKLSEEDTGTGEKIHKNSSATEWFVAFYKPHKVIPANDLAHGFLAEDRSNHSDYERVPYAFPFRAGGADLVFISVHLQPGGSKKETARRAHEFESIFKWIANQNAPERDYVILGDMNIEDCEELASILPTGFASLNNDCIPTNTSPKTPKPYDHVIYNEKDSANEMANNHFQVIDLVVAMGKKWSGERGSFPGNPYRHKEFRMRYSDHHPIALKIVIDGTDDD
ncbi:endonuclease/exonuclease/phosphatase family protein [uncultured Pseudodesulfovibrio sp.]|uniref:endonuclease/exonuclease/phosphatase family protein n=1 Tax=uncultured Pseudodesulfovibrio sp. TaxID=2035858 RepID=UPI0029C85329|nr:endonuclease/exonuclease/phosphatase family protein [uncultured Pseudodesulfovibrio sp.]